MPWIDSRVIITSSRQAEMKYELFKSPHNDTLNHTFGQTRSSKYEKKSFDAQKQMLTLVDAARGIYIYIYVKWTLE